MINHLFKNNFTVFKFPCETGSRQFQLDNFFYFRKYEKGEIVLKPATMLVYPNPLNDRPSANVHLLEWHHGKDGNKALLLRMDNAVQRFSKRMLDTLDPMEISVRLPQLFAELRMVGFTSRLKFSQSLGFN